MNNAAELLIPITLFLSIVGIFYLFITTRNKERMAMIERGADASLFQSKPRATSFFLKIGMLMVGVAIGILVGWLISNGSDDIEFIMPASIFLFGGAALVSTFFIERNILKGDKKEE